MAEHDVVFLTYQNSFRLQLEENTLTSLKRMRLIKACLVLRDLAIHVANPYTTCCVLFAEKT